MDVSKYSSETFSLVYQVVAYIVSSIGFREIFRKCGIKKWYAWIPVYRIYQLSICARREDQGKRLMFTSAVLQVLTISYTIFGDTSYAQRVADAETAGFYVWNMTFLVLLMAASIVEFVYHLRVYIGMCESFGRRKRWIWMWLFLEPVAALIWGFSKKIHQISEEESLSGSIESISGIDLRGADGALDIDIRSRSVKALFSKRRELLKDIKLTIQPGTMVLLLGGSGAGKTTFVNAVIGYEKADATVTLDHRDVYREFSSMKYDIGFVPQMDLIRYNDTVRKTIEDVAKLRMPVEVTKEEREQKIDNTLEIFGLRTVQNNLVAKLSGGQKKRTSIATEFVSDPSLFILDEPDSGLDGVLARDLMERLHAISRKGKIVIVITHSPDRVIDLFDEVIILAKDENRTGRLVFNGKIDDARAFFGRERMEDIVKMINRRDEGGEGMSDELIQKFEEVRRERA